MQLKEAIDKANVREEAKQKERYHLGGSQIGHICDRHLLYSFRKARKEPFEGRMLRLFNRGHEEEFRFVRWLRLVGFEVREFAERLTYHSGSDSFAMIPWDREWTLEPNLEDVSQDEASIRAAISAKVEMKQWQITGYLGHFSGSLDAEMICHEPGLLDKIPVGVPMLGEFKTHNTKSFCKLVEVGSVAIQKPMHYAQMQVYMHYKKLQWALYCAVNKNDDDLYFEEVAYSEADALKQIEKSKRIIDAQALPARFAGASPAFFDCKYCAYKGPCWSNEPMARSCRTCKFAQAVEDKSWRCNHWQNVIPNDFLLKGCDNYTPITD